MVNKETSIKWFRRAVEKALKSVFAMLGKTIPRTHYIDELANKLELPYEITNKILDLTTDYTLSRYPDVSGSIPFTMYDEPIATEKVEKAKIIFSYLTDKYWQQDDENN